MVGLEIKREALEGHLSSSDQLMLPLLAPAGGRAVPAAIYTLITYEAEGGALLRGGWAIPSATDIAFALGALTLLVAGAASAESVPAGAGDARRSSPPTHATTMGGSNSLVPPFRPTVPLRLIGLLSNGHGRRRRSAC